MKNVGIDIASNIKTASNIITVIILLVEKCFK